MQNPSAARQNLRGGQVPGEPFRQVQTGGGEETWVRLCSWVSGRGSVRRLGTRWVRRVALVAALALVPAGSAAAAPLSSDEPPMLGMTRARALGRRDNAGPARPRPSATTAKADGPGRRRSTSTSSAARGRWLDRRHLRRQQRPSGEAARPGQRHQPQATGAGTPSRSTPSSSTKGKQLLDRRAWAAAASVDPAHAFPAASGNVDSVTGRRNLSALQQNWTHRHASGRNDGAGVDLRGRALQRPRLHQELDRQRRRGRGRRCARSPTPTRSRST